jgi:hypothetical protein
MSSRSGSRVTGKRSRRTRRREALEGVGIEPAPARSLKATLSRADSPLPHCHPRARLARPPESSQPRLPADRPEIRAVLAERRRIRGAARGRAARRVALGRRSLLSLLVVIEDRDDPKRDTDPRYDAKNGSDPNQQSSECLDAHLHPPVSTARMDLLQEAYQRKSPDNNSFESDVLLTTIR